MQCYFLHTDAPIVEENIEIDDLPDSATVDGAVVSEETVIHTSAMRRILSTNKDKFINGRKMNYECFI